MSTAGKYTSIQIINAPCQGERFGPDGFPLERCKDTPVFQLTHSSGRSLHLCEYHIEIYWNLWLPFRDAVRNVWPVQQPLRR